MCLVQLEEHVLKCKTAGNEVLMFVTDVNICHQFWSSSRKLGRMSERESEGEENKQKKRSTINKFSYM